MNELKNKYYLKDFHNIEQLLEYLDIKKSKADYEKEYKLLSKKDNFKESTYEEIIKKEDELNARRI